MIKRLNSREKVMVSAALVLILLVIGWLALINPYVETMNTLDRRIAAHRRNLQRAEVMRGEILQLRQLLSTVNTQGRSNRPLFAQVESLTEQTGVREQLLSMRPQPATTQGDYRQQLVEIRLEKLSLGQLVKLLYAVEYRSGGVQVKSLRIKPRFDDRASLDVNLVLMSLEKP